MQTYSAFFTGKWIFQIHSKPYDLKFNLNMVTHISEHVLSQNVRHEPGQLNHTEKHEDIAIILPKYLIC